MRRRLALLTSLALVTALAPVAAQAVDLPGVRRDSGPRVFAPAGETTDRFAAVTTPDRASTSRPTTACRCTRGSSAPTPAATRPGRPRSSSSTRRTTTARARATPTRSLDLVERFTPKGYTVVLSDVRGTGNSGGCGEQDGAQPGPRLPHAGRALRRAAVVQRQGRLLRQELRRRDPEGRRRAGTQGPRDDGRRRRHLAASTTWRTSTACRCAASGVGGAAAYEVYDLDVPGPARARLPASPARHTCQPANFVNGADPRGDANAYWSERDFRAHVGNVKASVLEVQGLNDFTVAPIQLDGWYDQLPTFKRAVFGQWAHNYPYDTTERPGPRRLVRHGARLVRPRAARPVHRHRGLAGRPGAGREAASGAPGRPSAAWAPRRPAGGHRPRHGRAGRRHGDVGRDRLAGPRRRAADRAAAPVRPGLPGRPDHPGQDRRARRRDAVRGAGDRDDPRADPRLPVRCRTASR